MRNRSFLLSAFLAACSLSGPLRVDRKAVGYSFGAPGTRWTSVQVVPELAADYVFSSRSDGTVLSIGSVCDRYLDSSLEALTKDLTNPIGKTELESQDRLSVDGREGLLTSTRGSLDGVPVSMRTFVIRKNDCLFDFTLSAKGQIAQADLDDFDRVVKGFRYSEPGSSR